MCASLDPRFQTGDLSWRTLLVNDGVEHGFPHFADARHDQTRVRDFCFRALVNWCVFAAHRMPAPPKAPEAAVAGGVGEQNDGDVDDDDDEDVAWTDSKKKRGARSAPSPAPPAKGKLSAKEFLAKMNADARAAKIDDATDHGRFHTEMSRIKLEVADFIKHGWGAAEEDQDRRQPAGAVASPWPHAVPDARARGAARVRGRWLVGAG
jgi:hypothetical protein